MNEQQKIELGKEITDYISFAKKLDKDLYLEVAEIAINKIKFLESSKEMHYNDGQIPFTACGEHANNHNIAVTSLNKRVTCKLCLNIVSPENLHTCGVCYQTYPKKELPHDFGICEPCRQAGNLKNVLQDKNRNFFSAGDTLSKESDLTEKLKIIQINETHVLDDFGGSVSIKDFFKLDWIVHAQIKTTYKINGSRLSTFCKFIENRMIGSIGCQDCQDNQETNIHPAWVICGRYNNYS